MIPTFSNKNPGSVFVLPVEEVQRYSVVGVTGPPIGAFQRSVWDLQTSHFALAFWGELSPRHLPFLQGLCANTPLIHPIWEHWGWVCWAESHGSWWDLNGAWGFPAVPRLSPTSLGFIEFSTNDQTPDHTESLQGMDCVAFDHKYLIYLQQHSLIVYKHQSVPCFLHGLGIC